MKAGDLSKEQILAINKMFKFQLAESNYPEILFYELERMVVDLFSTGEMTIVALDMINHFKSGLGTDYSNDTLTKNVREHATTKDYIELVKSELIYELENNNGDLSALQYNENAEKTTTLYESIHESKIRPVFHTKKDILTGLTITINDTWGNTVKVKDYSLDDKKFKGTLHFRIYDHFGLDKPDVEKKYVYLAGFRAWFVLQHYDKYDKKYKPFKTIIEIDVPFEGELD